MGTALKVSVPLSAATVHSCAAQRKQLFQLHLQPTLKEPYLGYPLLGDPFSGFGMFFGGSLALSRGSQRVVCRDSRFCTLLTLLL